MSVVVRYQLIYRIINLSKSAFSEGVGHSEPKF